MDGISAGAVPDESRLALVGNTDGRDVGRVGAREFHGTPGGAQLTVPDLFGVMLDPARSREILGELVLFHGDEGAALIEKDGP